MKHFLGFFDIPKQGVKKNGNLMSDRQRLDEHAISKIAKTLLSDRLNVAQEIDVDIRTNPIKAVQGEVDSISITGKGLVTEENLHLQKLELDLDCIDVNLLSILVGKIELNQPINSTGRLVFSEADLNQNLNSDYFASKIIPLELNVDGKIVLLEFQPPMELHLPGEGKVVFSSDIKVVEPDRTQQVRFTGVIYPRTHNHSVLMEKFFLGEGQAISLEVLVTLMQTMKKLIDAPYLEFQDTKFRIKEMKVELGLISLEVEAQINQIPS